MAEMLILDPLPGDRAFLDVSAEAAWSQAAQLIGVGVQLRGDGYLIDQLEEEVGRLRLPRVASTDGVDVEQVLSRVPLANRTFEQRGLIYPEELGSVQTRLWEEARVGDDLNAAPALLYTSLFSRHEITRVAAAVALRPLMFVIPAFLDSILVDGCISNSETVRHLAADAVARFNPENAVLAELIASDDDDSDDGPAHTSTMIHGTWARWEKPGRRRPSWWRPGSKFFKFVRDEARLSPDLYAGEHYPRWSGGYHEQDRIQGAEGLRRWCAVHTAPQLNVVYAHSYGAQVLLSASGPGVKYPPISARVAMLLSAPAVIPPDADTDQFDRILSLRTHFDVVLLADGSPQSYPPPIEELRAPIRPWYGHGATHSRFVWRWLHIARELKFEFDNTPRRP